MWIFSNLFRFSPVFSLTFHIYWLAAYYSWLWAAFFLLNILSIFCFIMYFHFPQSYFSNLMRFSSYFQTTLVVFKHKRSGLPLTKSEISYLCATDARLNIDITHQGSTVWGVTSGMSSWQCDKKHFPPVCVYCFLYNTFLSTCSVRPRCFRIFSGCDRRTKRWSEVEVTVWVWGPHSERQRGSVLLSSEHHCRADKEQTEVANLW